jgi:hypothetical protein
VESLAVVLARVSIPQKGIDPAELAEKIKEKFPEEVIEVTNFRDQVSVIVKKDGIFKLQISR